MNLDLPGPFGSNAPKWRLINVKYLSYCFYTKTPAVLRLFDIILSFTLIILLLPLLILRGWYAWRRGNQVFILTRCLGKFNSDFNLLKFAGGYPGANMAILFNILRGDMAFVGPRLLSTDNKDNHQNSIRFLLRPGLFSIFALREDIGIAYEAESEIDREFYYAETFKGNIGLLLRGSLNKALSRTLTNGTVKPSFSIFGVSVTNTSMDEAISWIISNVKDNNKSVIFFVNPFCLNTCYTNREYQNALRLANRILPDGIGVNIACRMLGERLISNVNGTDLFPRLCEKISNTNISIYLLGARPDIAELVAKNMLNNHPGLRIAGVQHGYFDKADEPVVIDNINKSHADILLVAFGVPKQELWIAEHCNELQVKIMIGVGGLFDFYSNRIPRAPLWMREIGLEWVWRLLQEPKRMWQRYIIGNPLFLYRVWLEKSKKSFKHGVFC